MNNEKHEEIELHGICARATRSGGDGHHEGRWRHTPPTPIGASTYEPYTFTTLAGNRDGGSGSVDGTGGAARFDNPNGVAVDSTGNVYVADLDTLRKGYPAPRILTSGPGFGFNDGQFGFDLTGPAGKSVVVEASADLVNWLPL